MTMPPPAWGPTGELVFRRTYSRTKSDGSQETWEDTVRRVAAGNLALVHGDQDTWTDEVIAEYDELVRYMYNFKIIPGGRHLWATGVANSALNNCFQHSGDSLSRHAHFMLSRLMEGGGVGSNYSKEFADQYGQPKQQLQLHLVCDPQHADHAALRGAGVLSNEYSDEWTGAYPVEDSRQGWAAAVCDLIETFYRDDVRHTNRVYDLAHVRPNGARLKTFGGTASGPLPLAQLLHTIAFVLNRAQRYGCKVSGLDAMEIDHAIGAAVVAGGVRRSARMSIMHWDDPQIDEFVTCKKDTAQHWTTNISVAVDDEFFAALGRNDWRAYRVWWMILRGMLKNGEPGVWNYSYSQKGEVRPVTATNPCGEIALESTEPCNLGHVNMAGFIRADQEWDIYEAHRLMTRFLIRATYGNVTDPETAEVVKRNRRIGLGHFGIQAHWVMRGYRYSELPELSFFKHELSALAKQVRTEAREYAFKLRIPEPIKVTCLAPTGTISKLAGTTEGLQPIFARHFERRIRFSKTNAEQIIQLQDFADKGYVIEDCLYAADTAVVVIPMEDPLVAAVKAAGWDERIVESSDEVPLDSMLAIQEIYQTWWADNAISVTVSVPQYGLAQHDLSKALKKYLPRLKGVTVFPDASRPQAPYTRLTEEQWRAHVGDVMYDTSNDEECATGSCPIR